MVFKKDDPLFAKEVERKEGETVVYVNFMGASYTPSISDNPDVMRQAVDLLIETPETSRIVFVQQRNYSYSSEQVLMLSEIARIYNFLIRNEDILSGEKLFLFGNSQEIRSDIVYLLDLLKSNPLFCQLEINKRIELYEQQIINKNFSDNSSLHNYLFFLQKFNKYLESTKLSKLAKGSGEIISLRNRDIYSRIFRANILPNFTFTRLLAQLPSDSELIDQYVVELDGVNINVTILKKEDESKYFYHIMPPEYILNEDQHILINLARNVLTEHRPKAEEFTDPEKTRQVFFNVARDLVTELSKNRNLQFSYNEIDKLAKILVRHTIGFGLIEVLLADDKLQDIVLNSPIAQNPVFVRHQDFDECVTNIMPSYEDADSWAAKLRLQSGRSLDEANPVLDTDLSVGESRARVAAITAPLSPNGLAYAFRRHRDKPWTLPLFIDKKMLNSFAAGLLSFMIDGSRTLLVAGTRSAGKTSLLGSLMLEILPKFRTIVVEDTLELPVDSLRKIGYDILRMKVRSALVSGTSEVEASEGIRTSLRLGDSALIVGEVRSEEAKALYEAMRVGALANVVAGTIHGDSPYGVYDRVVNDLNVPKTSFKATDLIIVTNPIKSSDGLSSKKRVVRITEVRKHWQSDPLEEAGFVDLMRYNVEKDELEPTEELINGDSEIIKSIASNVQGWAGNWDSVFDNIVLRGKVKQEIVNVSKKFGNPELMEAKFNSLCNVALHRISEEVKMEEGIPKEEIVFPKFKEWLYKKAENF